jgi:hypothetical protein
MADRLLLRALALGNIALAGALIGAVAFFFDKPLVAIVLGIVLLFALPPAIGSLALWHTMRSMRSYHLDLGGLDPETYFCATANDPNLKS